MYVYIFFVFDNLRRKFFLGQNVCPANYSSQMRFADPVVCSQYSQCVDGHLETRTCSNSLLFDRITKTCKPYEQAECHGNKPDLFSQTTTISPSELIKIFNKLKYLII